MHNIWIILAAWLTLAFALDNLPQVPREGRIVGGQETTITHFPYLVSLQLGTRHACGATILRPNIVLTAAHCVLEYSQPQLYAIRAGSTQWSSGGVYIAVRRIIPHARFHEPTRMNNDIALILLEKSLVFGVNIQPIELVNYRDFVPFQAMLFVCGWGAKQLQQTQPEASLRYTYIAQQNHDLCRMNYQLAGIVTNNMLCAGSQFGGRDSCQGDSGGPLVTKVDGRTKQLGLVSWGLSCANPAYPGIYTRLTNYGEWVAQTIHLLTSSLS